MDTSRVQQQIEEGLSALHLGDAPELSRMLLNYLGLLAKWNRVYNLTAVREPEDMVSRHLMDSLAIVPLVGAGRVLDVGTGAGLPGLVLAMARPVQQFVLLDSSGKKTRFVEHAVTRLGLHNVEVVRARAEDHEDAEGFEVVMSRAFSSVADFIRAAGHLACDGGCLLAMKGAFPEVELEAMPAGWQLRAAHKLSVPGLDGRRHLLEFCREDAGT